MKDQGWYVSELAMETEFGWIGGLMSSLSVRGGQQLCSSLL